MHLLVVDIDIGLVNLPLSRKETLHSLLADEKIVEEPFGGLVEPRWIFLETLPCLLELVLSMEFDGLGKFLFIATNCLGSNGE